MLWEAFSLTAQTADGNCRAKGASSSRKQLREVSVGCEDRLRVSVTPSAISRRWPRVHWRNSADPLQQSADGRDQVAPFFRSAYGEEYRVAPSHLKSCRRSR